jgi:ribose transport system permease protein
MRLDLLERIRARPWGFALLLTVVLLIANQLARSSFAAWSSWPANLADFAPFALAAMATTPAVLSGGGGIDISIGPLLNLVSVMVVGILIPHGLGSIWVAVPITVALGALVGAINGVLVGVFRFQAVLATLCGLFVLTGVGLAILAEPTSGTVGWLTSLGNKVGPVPGGLIMILIPIGVWVALGRTAFRRSLYSVGGDDLAAYSAGVNVRAVRIVAYTIGGVFAALAGIALAAATQSADPNQATQYTLPAIAAVAIGGTSLLGGRGSLVGSILGAAIMFMLQTLLDSLAVNSNWLQVAYGVILIGALVLSYYLSAGPNRRPGSATAPAKPAPGQAASVSDSMEVPAR